MANRIQQAIALCQSRIDTLPPEKVAELDKANVFDFAEFVSLQNAKSAAHASGKLSTEEAQVIYMALGEGGPDRINKAPLATRIALTLVHAELLGIR